MNGGGVRFASNPCRSRARVGFASIRSCDTLSLRTGVRALVAHSNGLVLAVFILPVSDTKDGRPIVCNPRLVSYLYCYDRFVGILDNQIARSTAQRTSRSARSFRIAGVDGIFQGINLVSLIVRPGNQVRGSS